MKAIVVGKDPLPFMKFFEVGVGRQRRRGQGGAFPTRTEGWESQGINI